MLNNVSERTMHRVRWLLAIGWLILIASLFYDPLTPLWTQADNLSSPFRIDPNRCIKIRETCLPQVPFSMSALIWWAMIVPAGIFIIFVLGHEFWRRICPLSFMSQIPRALGIQRRRQVADPVTGNVRWEVVTIGANSWLGRNHLYLQFGLFVLGLGARILFVNSDRWALGFFLVGTIISAILVGYLYAGKSWCHYFCPMAPVQLVYTGPRSLLGSQNHHQADTTIPQSMCRTVSSKTGSEQSSCVGCKAACFDIDAEKTYWTDLRKPGRRLVQYGYLGMVIAFYLYYFLYAGNWDYYFTGTWTHEAGQLANVWDTGFYLYGHQIGIPKAIAVYLTLLGLTAITWTIGLLLEKLVRRYLSSRKRRISQDRAQHLVFTLYTVVSFWTFFSYGARPSLNRLPDLLLWGFNALIVLVGSVWFYRTIRRSQGQYERESMTTSLRQQLQRLDLNPDLLGGRSLQDLTSDEIYTLVNVLQGVSQQMRLQTYQGVVLDLLQKQATTPQDSFEFFHQLRQDLQLKDSDHFATLEAIAGNHPDLLAVGHVRQNSHDLHHAVTLATTIAKFPKS